MIESGVLKKAILALLKKMLNLSKRMIIIAVVKLSN